MRRKRARCGRRERWTQRRCGRERIGLENSASTKLSLRRVSSDLLNVAGGLCFILKNCEIRLPPRISCPAAYEGEHTSGLFLLHRQRDLPAYNYPQCLWPQIQHPEKLLRGVSALEKRKHGSPSQRNRLPRVFRPKASVSSLIFDVYRHPLDNTNTIFAVGFASPFPQEVNETVNLGI